MLGRMKTSKNLKKTIKLQPVVQQTDSHCGPATLQILFAFLNKSITQDQVVEAARVKSRLTKHGMRPDQLARAVAILAPDLQFWFKEHTTSRELATLIHEYQWPVAVNWQGLFYDTVEEEKQKNPHGEHGHYSIVTDINVDEDKIVIMDPYSEYYSKPRQFSLTWFKKRWWDVDHEVNRKTGQKNSIKTQKLIFIVAPKDTEFLHKLKMQLPDQLARLIQ